MKNLKLTSLTLIGVFLTIGLAGFSLMSCNRTDRQQDGLITLSFWHSMAEQPGILFNTFVREFNEGIGAEKGIVVEAIFQGQYADATAKLRPLLHTRRTAAMPDIMQMDATGVVDFLNSDLAWTVDDALARDRDFDLSQIVEAPLRAWNYGGRQLGLPVSASTTIMYYNRSILDAAGISAPPTTFDEIIEISQRLPRVNVNNQRLTAYAQQPHTPNIANWIGQMPGQGGVNASYLVDNRNGRDGIATRLVADTESTLLTFLRAWQNMYDAGAILNVSDGLTNLFLTQQIVFFTSSSAHLTNLRDQIDGRFELGTAFFPRVHENSNFGATVSGSALFMFNRGNPARTDAAWEFVKFMTSADIQARLAAATGYIPVNYGAKEQQIYIDHVTGFPQAATGLAQLEVTSPDMLGVIVGPSRNFFFELINQVSTMLEQRRTPEETVTNMARALNLLLHDFYEANR